MQKQNLLLVEDSEDDAFLFIRTFEKSGTAFGVHHVPNGAEAIEYLRAAAGSDSLPRIVLLDLKMPMVNGFDVLKWLQKQTFSSKVPVVVVSGSVQQEDKDRASQLGAADYLVKPVTVADLRRLLTPVSSDSKDPAPSEAGIKG
ncbi:MAG TPA: response regulator [Candidatus Baltobacteraceae bacterium]|nr:response regulator [Candidatus Baltobacteraceae bacterium]